MAALNRLLLRSYPAARRVFSSLSPDSESVFSLPPPPPAASGLARHNLTSTAGRKEVTSAAAERNVQWVFLGCPGVGKGTYASRLSNLLGAPHISTGDLVRDELNSDGPLSVQG